MRDATKLISLTYFFPFLLLFIIIVLLIIILSLVFYNPIDKIQSILDLIAISLLLGEVLIKITYIITFMQYYPEGQFFHPRNIPDFLSKIAFTYSKILYLYLFLFFLYLLYIFIHKFESKKFLFYQIKVFLTKKTFLIVIISLLPAIPFYFIIAYVTMDDLMNLEWDPYYRNPFLSLVNLLLITIIFFSIYFFIKSQYSAEFRKERISMIAFLSLVCFFMIIYPSFIQGINIMHLVNILLIILLYVSNLNIVPEQGVFTKMSAKINI